MTEQIIKMKDRKITLHDCKDGEIEILQETTHIISGRAKYDSVVLLKKDLIEFLKRCEK